MQNNNFRRNSKKAIETHMLAADLESTALKISCANKNSTAP